MRIASHGRDVAQISRERALTDDRRGLLAAEMHVLDRRIDLEEQILTGARAEDGAVVADAQRDARTSLGQLAQFLDDGDFIHETRDPMVALRRRSCPWRRGRRSVRLGDRDPGTPCGPGRECGGANRAWNRRSRERCSRRRRELWEL